MRARFYLLTLFTAAMLCAATQNVWAQAKPVTRVEVFKVVKPGQWVQLEGKPQKDYSVIATEIKVLTGDFQDDDWEVFGNVRVVNKQKNEFEILLLKIKLNEDTDYETSNLTKSFKSLADVKPDMLVEVEGTYLKDGTFLADEIQDETEGKHADETGTVTMVGKAEKVDPVKSTVTVMGVKFQITPSTQTKSAIK